MAKKIEAVLELDTRQAERGINQVSGALKALVSVAAAKEIFNFGNELQEIQNKLRAVSTSAADAAQRFDLVAGIADRTRSGLAETTDLYFRLTKASENLGLTGAETAQITESFAKSLKNSGATAQEAQSAILQFGQAMASGKLSGDEFRSINESNSTLMDVLAKAIGKPRGALKDLAAQGKLTGDIVANAILESADVIDNDFGKTTQTLAESITKIKNEILILFEKIEEKTGVFNTLGNAIAMVGDNLNYVAAAMAYAFGAAVAARIATIIIAVSNLKKIFKDAATAAAILQGVTGVGLVKVIGGLTASGGALYLMNQLFDESAENAGELTAEIDKAVNAAAPMGDAPTRAAGSTQEMFENVEATVEAEDALNEQLKEQERILARQLENFNAISGELRITGEEFDRNLDLNTRLLTAIEDEKALIQGIADIESERADALNDLNELTLLSAEQRAEKEAEINDEYNRRIENLREQVDLENQINRVLENRRQLRGASDEYAMMAGSLQNLMERLDVMDTDERNRMKMRFELGQELAKEEQDLKDKYNDIRLGKELELGRELTDSELEFLREKYQEELAQVQSVGQVRMIALGLYLDKLDEVNTKIRSFSQGWQDAFVKFKDMVENEAAYGARLFETMSQGWEDAIVRFAETGKLSFKDLFKSLLREIIKMQANKLFLALFGGGGLFDLTSIFSGKKQHGGFIPAGKFGIAGEAGAEIVTGPAHVTSANDTARMLGSGGVTNVYNISAVDTQSFRTALLRDGGAEFLFSAVQSGRRRLPV
jgi:lambda family phage tail tape measure protein